MTPRAAFIEATRKVVEEIRFIPSAFSVVKEEIAIAVLAQVEAVANGECEGKERLRSGQFTHDHTSCRAALRKECGIE